MRTLPQRLAAKIKRLAKRTGETPLEIVKRAVDLYERVEKLREDAEGKRKSTMAALNQVVEDGEQRTIFASIMSRLGRKSSSSLTDEQRRERATKAAQTRWRKKRS